MMPMPNKLKGYRLQKVRFPSQSAAKLWQTLANVGTDAKDFDRLRCLYDRQTQYH
jgi:hypothetical protein